MEKEFVPYELSLKMKELGFDEPCLDNYNTHGGLWQLRLDKQSKIEGACLAPLYQQAFRWFREKHELFSSCDISNFADKTYGYVITSPIPPHYLHNVHNLKSMEEAELACLSKLIEIVETRTK